jgi:hypothetical protein
LCPKRERKREKKKKGDKNRQFQKCTCAKKISQLFFSFFFCFFLFFNRVQKMVNEEVCQQLERLKLSSSVQDPPSNYNSDTDEPLPRQRNSDDQLTKEVVLEHDYSSSPSKVSRDDFESICVLGRGA